MITRDKILHVIAGFVITLFVGFIAYYLCYEYPQGYGILAGVLAGVGKEAFDEYRYGGADFFDLFATIVGVFFGGALVVLFT